MIYVDGANLTVGGDGKLTGTSRGYALRADKDITINGGTVEVSAYSTSILSWGDVIINGGDIVAESVDRMGIYANDITINGGDVTAIGGYEAIDYGSSCSFTVAENLKIQASTTVDGELGEYVAANHDRYKKIVVRPAPDVYVGGVGMYDGDYLAVGATKTQTTKPYGGYAYYKNGTLTLNNYSYEGEGYRLGAVYIDGTDLTIELLGDNTLVQTKSGRDAICADAANLTIGGTGNLTCRGEDHGIWVGEGLTINGGTITAIGNIMAIRYNSSYGCNVAEGLTMQASTTVDGELGKYVAENHISYKKIVITEKPVDPVKPNPFTDVPVGSFCYEPVQWAVDNGITNGTSATTFDPLGTCLRAHVVTFLHRAAGNPEPASANNPFTDVKPGDFFYKPVLWAVEKGITNGISATQFGSANVCNRSSVVTFLWRAMGSPEPETVGNPFVDVKSTDFFYKAVLWAVEKKITNGVDATHFSPAGTCNRAQVVTFLYRAYN